MDKHMWQISELDDLSNGSATCRHVLVLLDWYSCLKIRPKKFFQHSCNTYFMWRTKWNGLQASKKQKAFPEAQICFPKSIKYKYFGLSAPTAGGLWALLNHPHTKFKETVCPKNVCMRRWTGKVFTLLDLC